MEDSGAYRLKKLPHRQMGRYIWIGVAIAMLALVYIKSSVEDSVQDDADVTEMRLRTTPVSDQGTTSVCWIHAMLACIETERIEQYNDSLVFSVDWLLDHLNTENALRQSLLKHGNGITGYFRNTAYMGGSTRATGPDALRLIEHYGLQTNNVRGGRSGGFYLYGMHYTPEQFANSVYKKGDWTFYTSFSHHPYGKPFVLEIPDNYRFNEFMNVTPDSLLLLTVQSLLAHHPVYWEGKNPESFITGNDLMRVADVEAFLHDIPTRQTLKEQGILPTPASSRRQKLFEGNVLTDDHAMAIVGIGCTSMREPYFILKNSWGKQWGRQGCCRLPFKDFLLNTMLVGCVTQR